MPPNKALFLFLLTVVSLLLGFCLSSASPLTAYNNDPSGPGTTDVVGSSSGRISGGRRGLLSSSRERNVLESCDDSLSLGGEFCTPTTVWHGSNCGGLFDKKIGGKWCTWHAEDGSSSKDICCAGDRLSDCCETSTLGIAVFTTVPSIVVCSIVVLCGCARCKCCPLHDKVQEVCCGVAEAVAPRTIDFSASDFPAATAHQVVTVTTPEATRPSRI